MNTDDTRATYNPLPEVRKRPNKRARFAAASDSDKIDLVIKHLLSLKTPLQAVIMTVMDCNPEGLLLDDIRRYLKPSLTDYEKYERIPFTITADNANDLTLVSGHVAHTLNRMLKIGLVEKTPLPLANGKKYGKKPKSHIWTLTEVAQKALWKYAAKK